jgi:hypothetical protein
VPQLFNAATHMYPDPLKAAVKSAVMDTAILEIIVLS